MARGEVPAIAIGGRLYDEVAPVEAWQLGDGEVGLASFLFHRDYRDYYDRHGGIGYVTLSASENASLTLSYANENWSNRLTRDPITILLDGAHWRPNPDLDNGVFRTAGARLQLDSRNDENDPLAGWYASASVERGDGLVTRFGPTTGLSLAGGHFQWRRRSRDCVLEGVSRPAPLQSHRPCDAAQLSGSIGRMARRRPAAARAARVGWRRRLDSWFRVPQRRGSWRPACSRRRSVQSARPTRAGDPALCDRLALVQAELRHDLPVHLGKVGSRRIE